MLETSKEYLEYGLSVLPAIKEQKRPCIRAWKEYQKRLPTENELAVWFSDTQSSVCVVTGKVSGNLEIIDFDNNGEQYLAWKKIIPFDLFGKIVVEQTPSGGFHAIYRCEIEVPGNCKLARRQLEDGKIITLIETRAEGGLFLCAPTDGYKFIHKDFSGLEVITEAEREMLLMAAWSLNEYTPKAEPEPVSSAERNPQPRYTEGKRPGEDFNERGDIRDVLKLHGWTYVNTSGDNERWRRPGKKAGWSATLQKSTNTFYVFSSNAMQFDSQKAFSPFAVFAMLECNGDFAEAARVLLNHGYGEKGMLIPPDDSDIDLSGILANVETNKSIEPKVEMPEIRFPRRLLNVPGFIKEVMDHTLTTAAIPNETAALAGAIALQAMLAGRKVAFHAEAETRTNLYIVVLAGSSTGKNPPRNTNIQIIKAVSDKARDEGEAMAIKTRIRNKFASGQGIVKAVFISPSILFQVDEIDKLLSRLSGGRTDARTLEIEQQIMELYSSSTQTYFGDVRADEKNNIEIEEPNMCIFGTATPGVFYESLSLDALRNGFVGRILPIECNHRKKRYTLRERRGASKDKSEPSESIVNTASYWVGLNNGLTQQEPMEVPCDDRAVDILDKGGDMAHKLYEDAFNKYGGDCPDCAIWGRYNENRNKMALIYACSANATSPHIDKDAATWACDFVEYSCRLLVRAIRENVADTACYKLALRIKKKIARETKKQDWVIHGVVKKVFGNPAREFNEAVQLLVEREEIEVVLAENSRGSKTFKYRIIG